MMRAVPSRVAGAAGVAALLLLLLQLLAASQALAVPRYSLQYGQNCVLCHTSPTGGGMRSLYASQFLVPEEIAARGWNAEGAEGALAEFSPELSPNVTVGVDARTLLLQAEGGDGAVVSMQGDLYVDLQIGPTMSVYLEQAQKGGGEAWGMVTGLPADGYLRAGRIIPDYGWRFSDHRLATRRYLAGPAGSDGVAFLRRSGVEAGISPGPLFLSASVLEGGRSLGDSYAARALLMHEFGPVTAAAGGSVWRQSAPGGLDGRVRTAGGFWGLALGPVTWLGEYDEARQVGVLGNLAAHEVTVRMRRGLDLRLTYSFQDPVRAERTGARREYGAGATWMPAPYWSLLVMATRSDPQRGPDVDEVATDRLEAVLHFFY